MEKPKVRLWTFDFGGMEVEKTQLLTFDLGGIEKWKNPKLDFGLLTYDRIFRAFFWG